MPLMRRSFCIFITVVVIFLFVAFQFTPELYLGPIVTNQQQKFNKDDTDTIQILPYSLSTSTSVETTIPGDQLVHGFTLLNRVYLRNGAFFIVTSNNSMFPPRSHMIAPLMDIGVGHDMEPTDKELRIISPETTTEILGEHSIRIEGVSMIVYDTEQFMPHFYHWWGEIILGAWRVYSGLHSYPDDSQTPPFPARFILPRVYGNEWKDVAGMSSSLMRACFPSAAIEGGFYWEDLIALDKTFVFDRVMIISRETAHRDPLSTQWPKMIASTMSVNISEHFWEPIRKSTITNILSYIPELNKHGHVIAPHRALSLKPIITYISRQDLGRRLQDEDHNNLINALKELESLGICELHVVLAEKMTVKEQIEVMSKTTILIGVHGDSLTHQVWMPTSPRSTVIEILAPNSYTFDYEILARNMGHKHYAVWNDTLLTYPKGTYHEGINYPNDFHGNSIPAHGPSIAHVIRERLTNPI